MSKIEALAVRNLLLNAYTVQQFFFIPSYFMLKLLNLFVFLFFLFLVSSENSWLMRCDSSLLVSFHELQLA